MSETSQNPESTTTTESRYRSENERLRAKLDKVRAYVADPGNWSAYDNRRRLLLDWLSDDPQPEELASRDDLLLAYDRMSRGYVSPTVTE